MSLRHFIFGLSASFAFAWLSVIIIPFFKMRELKPIALSAEEPEGAAFYPKRAGRVADGARVYAENGCYNCHSQLIRPTYAGNDLFRSDWGGLKADPDRGDTRRETNSFDFFGEKFAHIGVSRFGPDLSNIGRRVEAEYKPVQGVAGWFYAHLYNPRFETEPDHTWSKCPSFRFLFEERKIGAGHSADAVRFRKGEYAGTETTEIVPTTDARALVSYLMDSLKKDQPVADSLNFAREKKDAAKK